ncbi:MAG TPA: MFS transporter [Hyphomicrobiales bacterium]|nr:MFS transporter [Hyphomicrobiales bacterium]
MLPPSPPPPEPAAVQPDGPSRRSVHGLDAVTFFVADVQSGFGPFIAVYLTTHAWTQTNIGLLLTVTGLVSLAGQIPGGALVDAVGSVRALAAGAVAAISLSALIIGLSPALLSVFAAQIIHAGASCLLGPAIAAISLGLVGYAHAGERFGRNARFASIGNAVAAAGMGAAGYLVSNQALFFLTALLGLPALLSLAYIRGREIDPVRAHGGGAAHQPFRLAAALRLLRSRALLVLAAGLALFHLANAAMLPLMASTLTMRSERWATLLVAACIVVPQIVVAAFSPTVGRWAERWGRRPLLLAGFLVLPLRGLAFALVTNPYLLVTTQVLDGIAGAVLGVLVPLIVADATRGSGRFNLAQGIVGSAMGVGASISTSLAGFIGDRYGDDWAFLGLAAIAAVGLLVILSLLPETRAQASPALPRRPLHQAG